MDLFNSLFMGEPDRIKPNLDGLAISACTPTLQRRPVDVFVVTHKVVDQLADLVLELMSTFLHEPHSIADVGADHILDRMSSVFAEGHLIIEGDRRATAVDV